MNLQFILKVLGCGLILTGSSGYGFALAQRYKARLDALTQLRQMILLLKGQMIGVNAPLGEAFLAIGTRTKGDLSGLFRQAAERILASPGEPFPGIWRCCVGALGTDCALSSSDRHSLAAMAEHLGYLDRELQEQHLLLYLEELDSVIQELRRRKQDQCRLYGSMGILCGIFLVLLIC
ncbi:MAG: stage III sporulation protein AB [Clostridiales bacterium]|nr:stage III sporulation protein AB [Clostridiales bacterium]